MGCDKFRWIFRRSTGCRKDARLKVAEKFREGQAVDVDNLQKGFHRDICAGFYSPVLHTTEVVIPCKILMAGVARIYPQLFYSACYYLQAWIILLHI